MASQWYYRKGEEKVGPISASQLKQLADSGSLSPSDFIWKDGLKEWVPARFVNGLFPPVELSMAQSISPPRTPFDKLEAPHANPPPPIVPPPPPPVSSRPTTATTTTTVHSPDYPSGKKANMAEAKPLDFGILPAFADFKSLDYEFLVPYKKIFSAEMLSKKAVRWVLFFGIVPLATLIGKDDFDLTFKQCFWILGAYFCLLWATYFHGILLPSPQVWWRGVQFAAFTAVVGITLVLTVQTFPIISGLYAHVHSQSLTARVFGFVFGVGICEEACKALPLLIFCLRTGDRLSLKETMFLGMMSGFGFAIAEGVRYSLNTYWSASAEFSVQETLRALADARRLGPANADAIEAQLKATLANQYEMTTLSQITRFVTLPLLHAAWAGVMGWFIAVASHHQKNQRAIVIVGLLLVATLHGLYDALNGLLGLAMAAITLIVFMGYLMHGQDDAPPIVEQTAL
jgi:RsiW-degrading membrane proteinase PrsW (M82 family)